MLLESDYRKTEITDGIRNEDVNVILLQRDMGEYYSWVICCEFSKKNVLKDNWEKVVDNVACFLQAELKLAIERYNIYIIFFTQEIEETLIGTIENDKYSSRKIVINENMPKDLKQVKNIVEKALFSLDLQEKGVINNNCLINLVKERDQDLYDLYVNKINDKGNYNEILKDYIYFICNRRNI